jgi:hypothetical protein
VRRPLLVAGAVALALVLVAAAAVVGTRWWRSAHRTPLEQATAYAPSDAQRLSWTDWAAVRARLDVSLDASSSGAEVQRFLDRGFDRDLTSASAMVTSAVDLQGRYGFSPATVDWELFSQSETGAAVIVHLPSSLPVADVAAQLERTGFTRPATGATSGEPWVGGQEALARAGASVSPELQYVALDASRDLAVTSDNVSYLGSVMSGLSGGSDLPTGVSDVIGASGSPLSASVYTGDYACSALAMSHAAGDDRAEGEALLRRAGEVSPMTGFAMSTQPSGHVRVAMAFETSGQARTNVDTRSKLAAGPAPGQGGTFPDRFSIASATATGRVATLDLIPEPGSYVLSDLSSGPVLFATC